MEYKKINNNDTGLLVRTKLNEMLQELISGNEGVMTLWKKLTEVNNSGISNSEELQSLYEELKNNIFQAMNYADKEINNLLSYINGIDGGVNGFAGDTSYNPEFPSDKAATVIGIGPGTFEHFLDEDGTPITINETVLVIFYKGAGVTYWEYSTIIPQIVTNEVSDEFGDSTTKVISQDFFTRIAKGVVSGEIKLESDDVLNSYNSADKCGLYVLRKDSKDIGHILITLNSDSSALYQVIFGSFRVDDSGLKYGGGKFTMLIRTYNIASLAFDVPDRGTWSEWSNFNDSFMAVMSEDTYNALVDSGKVDNDCMYYLYEEQ